MNKTDPDSRMMRTQGQPTVQGYNAQAAVTRGQIIVAAEIAVESPDFGHLEPVVRAALRELEDAGVTQRPEIVLADAGYWHTRADGEHRQRRNPGAGPARCRATRRTPGRDGTKVRTRSCAGCSPASRTRALQAPQSDGRAGVRAEQVQPRVPPLPTTRQSRSTLGVAVPSSNPQPAQAPHPLDQPSDRLRGRATPVATRDIQTDGHDGAMPVAELCPTATARSASRNWPARTIAFASSPISEGAIARPRGCRNIGVVCRVYDTSGYGSRFRFV